MKIAILMPMAEQRGGGELMLEQLLRHSRRADVHWLVIFFEGGPLVDAFRQLGAETRVVETGRLRHVHRLVWAVLRIASVLRQEDADLVFSWSGKPHLYGSPAAMLAGIPSAWYQLGSPSDMHLSTIDRIATLLPARAVVTLSRAGARAQAKLWPARPTPLVYPGVELEKFTPDRLPDPPAARRKLGLPEGGPLIGIVGRLQRWKGIHVFIEALPAVLEQYPEAHGVVVGGRHDLEPAYADEIKALIARKGLRDRVTLAGFQHNVPEWMQAMDVVVHASDHEPFGIVVIEAMALGKPVVAGDAGGPREIITEGEDGLLAPYGDAGALSRQVLRFLEDPAFMRAAGRAARRRALTFSPERYADDLVSALCALLQEDEVQAAPEQSERRFQTTEALP